MNSSGKNDGAPKSVTFVDLGPELALVWYFIPEKVLKESNYYKNLIIEKNKFNKAINDY